MQAQRGTPENYFFCSSSKEVPTEVCPDLFFKALVSDHLGNVRATFSDKRLAYVASLTNEDPITDFELDVTSWTDYYAFGAIMPGRNATTPAYRYGFNGMEKDDELKSTSGSSYDFGARIYDPRVGRWLSRDPLTSNYPDYSPYNFALNNSILYLDPDGEVVVVYIPNSWYAIYSSVLGTLSKDEVFAKVYEDLNQQNNLPSLGNQQGFFIVRVELMSKSDYERMQKDNAWEFGHFKPIGAADGTTATFRSDNDEYWTNGRIRLSASGFTYSTVYEEFFHAGQFKFYVLDEFAKNPGAKNPSLGRNPISMEVEAKIAKMQALVKKSPKSTAEGLRGLMIDQGISEYEYAWIFVTGEDGAVEFNTDVYNYLTGSDMSVEATDAVYDDIIKLGNSIDNAGYKFKDKKIDTSFEYLDSANKKQKK